MPAHSVERQPCSIDSRTAPALDATTAELNGAVWLRAGVTRGMGLARLGRDCLQRVVSGPELLLCSVQSWLKNDAYRRVALIAANPGAAEQHWCIKAAVSRRWWVRVASRFLSIRAWNAFRQGLKLRRLNLPTPLPLAVVSHVEHATYHEYLITEALPAASSLKDWLADRSSPHRGISLQRQRLARQLGGLLRRLHEHRFDHRDLKPTNLLVTKDDQIWLIDLDGVWRWWPVMPRARRVQNLGRLWAGLARGNVTASEALRFLLAYLPEEDRMEWKSFWRQVARRAERKMKTTPRRTAFPTPLPDSCLVVHQAYQVDQLESNSDSR